jgi:hypothetical protein
VRKWDLDRFCDEFKVNVLLATDADPVWKDQESWVWVRPSLLANPSVRAIRCGRWRPGAEVKDWNAVMEERSADRA